MKRWPDEQICILIKMYKQYPDLWKGDLKFRNSELRMNLWAHIAEVQETSVDEVQKKIRALRAKFSMECKRYKLNQDEYFKTKPWKFFRQLMFLLAENDVMSSSGSIFSDSVMSESMCSSHSSKTPSKLQDESQDFGSSCNFEDDKEEDEDDTNAPKKRRLNGQQEEALADALECIRTLLDENEKRDQHSIYGEYIAHKIRICNRNSTDIAIAQHHIENIIFNLTMGVYKQEGSAASETKDESLLAIPPKVPHAVPEANDFQPFIIPKPDPDA